MTAAVGPVASVLELWRPRVGQSGGLEASGRRARALGCGVGARHPPRCRGALRRTPCWMVSPEEGVSDFPRELGASRARDVSIVRTFVSGFRVKVV